MIVECVFRTASNTGNIQNLLAFFLRFGLRKGVFLRRGPDVKGLNALLSLTTPASPKHAKPFRAFRGQTV